MSFKIRYNLTCFDIYNYKKIIDHSQKYLEPVKELKRVWFFVEANGFPSNYAKFFLFIFHFFVLHFICIALNRSS